MFHIFIFSFFHFTFILLPCFIFSFFHFFILLSYYFHVSFFHFFVLDDSTHLGGMETPRGRKRIVPGWVFVGGCLVVGGWLLVVDVDC